MISNETRVRAHAFVEAGGTPVPATRRCGTRDPRWLRTCGSVLAALLGSSPALAQDVAVAGGEGAATNAASAIDEIVVTANKRREKLQDVPIAVSVVTGDQLARSGVRDTLGLASRIPGLNMQSSMNGTQPHLRGVGTTSISAGQENSIATYLDGVYIASVSGTLLQLDNIAQVEVLKGPQGTLFGRNATGGVISIRTKDPSADFGGDVYAGYGNYDTATGGGYVTGGLAPNLAANLAVRYSHQGNGWGRNLFNGHDVAKENNFAGRTKIVFTPSDRDKLTLSFDYSQTDGSSRSTYRPIAGEATNYGPGTTLASQRPDLLPYIASGAIANPAIVVGNPYTYTGGFWDVDGFWDPAFHYKGGGGSLHYSHDFDFGQVTEIFSYRKTNKNLAFSTTAVPAPILGAGWREKSHTYTNELQITAPPSSPVQWAAGVFLLDGSVGYYPLDIYGVILAPLTKVSYLSVETTKSAAAYAQATAPIPSLGNTNVTAGLRYTVERRGITGNTSLYFGPGAPPLVVGDTDAHKSFSKITWRLSIDHHLGRDTMIYASVNRGFKSGVYDTIPPGGPDAKPVEPEVLDAYEVGLKSEFLDRRLRVNLAAFYYKYSNLQVTVFNSIAAQLQNGAAAEIYGADLDVTARVASGLTLSGGLEVLHDRFTSFPDAQFGIPQPASAGGGVLLQVGDAAGNRLPYTPSFTGHVGLDYEFSTAVGAFALSATYYYNSGYYAGADNILSSPDYGLIDLGLDWTLADGATTVSLWGKNLSNAKYYTQMAAVYNPNGQDIVIAASPRTYGLTVRRKF